MKQTIKHFDELFKINEDGNFEPKCIIKIDYDTFKPGLIIIKPGNKLGFGFEVSKHAKEFLKVIIHENCIEIIHEDLD